jgi:collagenase-like PrtC family protease
MSVEDRKTYGLVVGYNGRRSGLERLLGFRSRIRSVYTGGLKSMIRGGRSQYIEDLDQLACQIRLAREQGISFELALNAPCGIPSISETVWWKKFRSHVGDLESLGVDGLVLSHPFLIETVKNHSNLRVTVSTICEIATVRSALYYESMGADNIVPSVNLNMRPKLLARIKDALKHAALTLMLNEHCLPDCPWRRFHYNHLAHADTFEEYHIHCKKLFLKKPYLSIANNVIRPEDLHRYLGITDRFKVVGRNVPTDDLLERVAAYAEGSYDGNYLSLSDDRQLSRWFHVPNKALDGLWERKTTCPQECESCGYCIGMAERLMKTTQGPYGSSDRPFYSEEPVNRSLNFS